MDHRPCPALSQPAADTPTRLTCAVSDGADGIDPIELTDDREEALRLKADQRGQFWCSTRAGGCGEPLVLAAGEIVRPYFRHHAGAACTFIDTPELAARAYEHLHYQRALRDWLAEQGHEARLEQRVGERGRVDLLVEVAGLAHVLEVQLSPITVAAWLDRTDRYQEHASTVTWLFGAGAGALAATEAARNLVALRLRLTAGRRVEVGVDDGEETTWQPLASCAMTASRLTVPGLAAARELVVQRRAERADRRAPERPSSLPEIPPGRRIYPRPLEPLAPHASDPPPPMTLARWLPLFPEAAGWLPSFGWGWLAGLDDGDDPSARAIAYATCELYQSGPVHGLLHLADQDAARLERVLAELVRVGAVALLAHSGVRRWQRAGR